MEMVMKKIAPIKLPLLSFCLATSVFLLSACQVQPLYSQKTLSQSGQTSLSAALQSITISDPKTRFDQLVRNELQFYLTSGSGQASGELPLILELTAEKTGRSVGISDVDVGPRAFFVTITAHYVLKDSRKAAPIAQGSQEGTATYDRVDQEFANIRSERDAEIRAAKAAALRLRQALAIALNKTL